MPIPPAERITVLIPTNSPFRLIRAPPEFPGLIDASVWIKSSYPSIPSPLRLRPLTIPEVTVWLKLKGCPIAIT